MTEVQELPASVTQVKKDLTDPRTISKKLDPDGRSVIAGDILQARREVRSTRESMQQKNKG